MSPGAAGAEEATAADGPYAAGWRVTLTTVVAAMVLANLVVDTVAAWEGDGTGALAAAFDALGLGALGVSFFPWPAVGWAVRWLVLALAVGDGARLAVAPSAGAVGRALVGRGGAWGLLGWRSGGAAAVGLAVTVGLAAAAAASTWLGHRGRQVPLAPPIGAGCFAVLQGGGRFLNHHRRVAAQRHALDLVAVRAVGPRTRRLVPRRLSDFLAWGAPVVSPVAGRVVAMADGLADGGPPASLPGNFVLLEPDGHPGWRVLLAHLRRGSVTVGRGERVCVGQHLGEVGSSGNSTEPHLHIHAQDEQGVGVPMRIGTRRPLRRNDVVRPLVVTR